jgi:uncharacterized protein
MGMAVGVFVAFTPTIPFHTVLAITLAFVFRGSKPAALIGSWLSNPLTIPVLYYGSFKLGVILLGRNIPLSLQHSDLNALIARGWDVAFAAIAGGALLGILPAVGGYFITLNLFRRIRTRRAASHDAAAGSAPGPIDGPDPASGSTSGPAHSDPP